MRAVAHCFHPGARGTAFAHAARACGPSQSACTLLTILGMMRVVPKKDPARFVYSVEVKRDWEDKLYYETPPKMNSGDLRALEAAALAAYDMLGCRDLTRIDFRVRDGVPYFLEANPLPGLNPEWSDLIIMCRMIGVTHKELIEEVFRSALARYGMTNDQ